MIQEDYPYKEYFDSVQLLVNTLTLIASLYALLQNVWHRGQIQSDIRNSENKISDIISYRRDLSSKTSASDSDSEDKTK